MGRGGDSRHGAIKNDIISDDRIGNDLYTFAGPEDDVSFDDIDPGSTSIDEYAGVLAADVRIVNYIVADDIAVGANLDFDAVVSAAGCAAQVMDVIALDEGIRSAA